MAIIDKGAFDIDAIKELTAKYVSSTQAPIIIAPPTIMSPTKVTLFLT